MAREPMRDVVVLVPGITGSVLRRDGRELWSTSLPALLRGVLTGGGALRDLVLAEDSPEREDLGDGVAATRLMPDVHLIPGLWKIDGYSRIAQAVKQAFEVEEGRNYFEFPYDWRRDARAAARRLAREAHGWLRGWREASGAGDARLVLLAHSLGGLACRYFLECLEGWKATRALVTFGTPYRGSLNSLDSLANGVRKGPFGIADLTDLTRSFTSVYQLLPIYPAYDPGDGTLVRVGQTDGIPNVDAGRAAAALAFHDEVKAAVEQNLRSAAYREQGYRVFPVVGIGQPTSLSARRDGDGVEMLRTYEGEDHSGDGTVPRVSATPLELSDAGRETFSSTRHASLQNADGVLVQLKGILGGLAIALDRFRAAPRVQHRLALDVGDVYWSDEPVGFHVRPDGDAGPLEARVEKTSGWTEQWVVRLPSTRGWGQAEFPPLVPGAYRIVVSGDAGVEPVSDVFVVLESRREPARRGMRPLAAARRMDDLGPMRGAPPVPAATAPPAAEPGPAPAEAVRSVLSAQGPRQLAVGQEGLVQVQLEVAAEASPLAHAVRDVALRASEKVTALLCLRNDALEAPAGVKLALDPPGPGRKTVDAFEVRGRRPGDCDVSVVFKQGGSTLGSVSFTVAVRGAAVDAPGRQDASALAAAPRPGDEDVLTMLVQEQRDGGGLRYRYLLDSERLGLNFAQFDSAPFLQHASPLAYVQSVNKQLVERVLVNRDDLRDFAREIRAVGGRLADQLFTPEMHRQLWDFRDRLRAIEVIPWEPYVPWELVRLRHPDRDEADDRFLGEYGLVRTLNGRLPPLALKAREWRTLLGRYPEASHEPVGSEVAEIRRLLAERGLSHREVEPNVNDLLELLAHPDFDVLHIACHGRSDFEDVDRAELILSDRQSPQGRDLVRVNATTVREEARLSGRPCLVFLNACETGRQGASLTDWGGWPRTFMARGAAAFVGTQWSVREGPAVAFAMEFYEALLSGATLSEAAGRARARGKGTGDASWLAYAVYGRPTAAVSS